jgi:hypothetical protein
MNGLALETRLKPSPTGAGAARRVSLVEIEAALRYWRREIGRYQYRQRVVDQRKAHAQALEQLYTDVLKSRQGAVLSDQMSIAESAALAGAKRVLDRG